MATSPAKIPVVIQLKEKKLRLELQSKHEKKHKGQGKKSKKSSVVEEPVVVDYVIVNTWTRHGSLKINARRGR